MNETDVVPAASERRLHPWSWLFVLIQQLKQFILPLIALLFFGQRANDDGPWWTNLAPLIAIGVLAATSLLRYFTYRYRIGSDVLSIRDGWLHRSLREIPFARIHNVVVHQSLLHRMFGVAEVRLESAGGRKPEAQMQVLRLDEALALERQVRQRGHGAAATPEAAVATVSEGDTLLSLPLGEVVRLGLVSNRGMIVAAAAFGGAWQLFPRKLMANFVESLVQRTSGYVGQLHLGLLSTALAVVVLLALAMLLLRGLSVLLALLQYYGFRLSEAQRRLTVERGLLARLRTSVARRRVQAWTLHEGVLHRLLKRRSLRIDTAVAQQGQNDQRTLKELAPIATPEACDALVRHLLPQAQWPREQWRSVGTDQWWRLCLFTVVWVPLAVVAASWQFGAWGLLPLLWLPWAAFKARRRVQRMGWSVDERLVAVRGGWWTRWWRFAELDKLQALRLERGPLDRRCGTASLWLDTAGANAATAPPLRLQFVPLAEAQALYAELSRTLARRRMRW